MTPEAKVISELKPTGVRPKFTPVLDANGFRLPPPIFGAVMPGRRYTNQWHQRPIGCRDWRRVVLASSLTEHIESEIAVP